MDWSGGSRIGDMVTATIGERHPHHKFPTVISAAEAYVLRAEALDAEKRPPVVLSFGGSATEKGSTEQLI